MKDGITPRKIHGSPIGNGESIWVLVNEDRFDHYWPLSGIYKTQEEAEEVMNILNYRTTLWEYLV